MGKKLILFFCATLMLAFGFSSCGDNATRTWTKTEVEEMAAGRATSVYFDLTNPTFNSVADATDYQETAIEGYSIDSIFRTMPPGIMRKVADVCVNKSGQTDKKQIVREFEKNKDVYLNMSENLPPASTKNDKSATGDGGSGVTKDSGSDSKVFSTEYSYSTDTVDGKPVRIQTKVEKSYVK